MPTTHGHLTPERQVNDARRGRELSATRPSPTTGTPRRAPCPGSLGLRVREGGRYSRRSGARSSRTPRTPLGGEPEGGRCRGGVLDESGRNRLEEAYRSFGAELWRAICGPQFERADQLGETVDAGVSLSLSSAGEGNGVD